MRVFIFLCCVLVVVVAGAASVVEKCDGIVADGTYYDKEVLKKDIDKPYQMVVNRLTNTLFFSYSFGPDEQDQFKSAYFDLNNREFAEIPNITDGFATAVDQDTGTVYLGGSDGIYTFDELTKSAIRHKANGKNIWSLFFKDNLYFMEYPSQKLYVYKGPEPEAVPEFKHIEVTQFAIDKNGELFIANETGLYGLEKGMDVHNATLYDDKVAIRGMALKGDGEVYFCGENGIFSLSQEKKFKLIVEIYDAFGLAFDKDDNIIYATSDEIVRLKRSEKKCPIHK